MGMCSRQERIQKDIDIVIQKCKAEKDCLFAGEFSQLGLFSFLFFFLLFFLSRLSCFRTLFLQGGQWLELAPNMLMGKGG